MRQLSFRAGAVLTSGTGFFRPIHSRWSWPLQEIVVNNAGIESRPPVVLPLLGVTKKLIEWHEVLELHYCWFGLRIAYKRHVTYELELTAPFAYDRMISFLRETGEQQHLLPRMAANTNSFEK